MDFDIPVLPVRHSTGVNLPVRHPNVVNLNKSLRDDISEEYNAVKQRGVPAKQKGVQVPAKQTGIHLPAERLAGQTKLVSGAANRMGVSAKQSVGPTKQMGATVNQIGGRVNQIGGTVKQLGGIVKEMGRTVKQIGGSAKHPSGPVKQPSGSVKQIAGSAIQSGGSSKPPGGFVKRSMGPAPQLNGPAKHVQRPMSKIYQPINENKAQVIQPKKLNKSINDIVEVPVRSEEKRPRRSATVAVNYNDDIDEKEFNKRTKNPSSSESGVKKEVDILNRGKKRKSMANNSNSIFNKLENEVNSRSNSKLNSSPDNYVENDKNKRSRKILPEDVGIDIPTVRNRFPSSKNSQFDKRPPLSLVGNQTSLQAPNKSILVSSSVPEGINAKNASIPANANIVPIVTSAKKTLVTNAKNAAISPQIVTNAKKASVANITIITPPARISKVAPLAKNTKIALPAPNIKTSLPASNSNVNLIATNPKIAPNVPDVKARKANNNDIRKRSIPYLKRQVFIGLVPTADRTEICYPWTWQRYPGTSRSGTWRNYPVSDRRGPKGRKYPGTGRRGSGGQIKFESTRHPENLSDTNNGVIWFAKNSSPIEKVSRRDPKLQDPHISINNQVELKEYADTLKTQQIEFKTCEKSLNTVNERLQLTDFNTEDQTLVKQKSSQVTQIDTKTDFMPSFNNNPDLSWEEARHKCNVCNIKYIIKCHLLAHNKRVHEKKQLEIVDKNLPIDKESIADMNLTPTQFTNEFVSDKNELRSIDDLESDGDESDSDVTSEEDEDGSDVEMAKDDDDVSDEDMEKEDDGDSDIEMDEESEEVYCANCDKEYDPAGEEDHSQCSQTVNS